MMCSFARVLVCAGATVVFAGCPKPDSNVLGDTMPGFEPCRASHLDEVLYDICPDDPQFPYDEWVSGVVEGEPGESGESEPVILLANSGDSWTLEAVADSGVADEGDVWFDRNAEDAPEVEVRVSAPCGDPTHWFAVRSATTGIVLAAGGVAAEASWDDWSIDATVVDTRCGEPVTSCPCSERCIVNAIRFSRPSGALDLFPTERSLIDDAYRAMTFERWTAEGASTCEDGRDSGQRWLILGSGG